MKVSPAAADVWKRAGKTFVQTGLPSLTAAYAHYQVNHNVGLIAPGVEAGAIAASAGAVSVLWNGSSALVGAKRAKKLADLEAYGKKLVTEALAAQAAAAAPPVAPTP